MPPPPPTTTHKKKTDGKIYICKITKKKYFVHAVSDSKLKDKKANSVDSDGTAQFDLTWICTVCNLITFISGAFRDIWWTSDNSLSFARQHGAVGRVSDSRARGPRFDIRSGHILSFLLSLIQEGQLSVSGKSMCTNYCLTAYEV